VTFTLTAKQIEARALLSQGQENTMLFGGSRSGKTFLIVRAIVTRAMAAPRSRHAIIRFRANAAVRSISLDTLPKVMELCFPGIKLGSHAQMGYFTLPNESEIWVGGLEDAKAQEKILGTEYATIFLNECSQIPWGGVGMCVSRLAQMSRMEVENGPDRVLNKRMYFDCNPPNKGHWTYKVFVQHRDPETNEPLPNPQRYAAMQMNPGDNLDNLGEEYIQSLKGLSARLQKRFLLGEFADANPNALFTDEVIDRWRVLGGELPDMQRIVVGVDPSGSGDVDNADNDAIGIVVAGLGIDGNAYVLEDCTVKAGPAVWGNIVASAYDRHRGDIVVAEGNFGGAMVERVIQTSARESGQRKLPYKQVTASRGKVVRAEPFSSLYESGKVRHVGYFRELEDELTSMSTVGYMGQGSPNRADALVWALTEIFPAMVKGPKHPVKPPIPQIYAQAGTGWMR
jgi:predicted phage terminase large subunit-like protein